MHFVDFTFWSAAKPKPKLKLDKIEERIEILKTEQNLCLAATASTFTLGNVSLIWNGQSIPSTSLSSFYNNQKLNKYINKSIRPNGKLEHSKTREIENKRTGNIENMETREP